MYTLLLEMNLRVERTWDLWEVMPWILVIPPYNDEAVAVENCNEDDEVVDDVFGDNLLAFCGDYCSIAIDCNAWEVEPFVSVLHNLDETLADDEAVGVTLRNHWDALLL
jgi:hypothetical protein